MYRLTSSQCRRDRGGLTVLATVLVVAAIAVSGCASDQAAIGDPAHVETLRLRITKVRNAIVETRTTIAKSRGAPYLPELYTRLAELVSEEARYHYQLAYERNQRNSKVLHVPQVRVLKEDAIGLYETILQRFPETPLAPRVLFNIGHEHRELGNFDEMREALQKLVDKYPDSPLRNDALLVLGDYHFDRNELNEAKGFYLEITKAKLDRLTGLGHYKLAWVWVNVGDCKRALADFEAAILKMQKWENRDPDAPDALAAKANIGDNINTTEGTQQSIDVRREALVDLAYCYSRERSDKKAVKWFRKMAYNRDTYLASLDRLANRYRVMDKAQGAMDATRELLRLGPANEDRLDDARTLYTALKKTKDYRRIGGDVRLMANALTRHYMRNDLDPEARGRLRDEFELYMRDLATTAQQRLDNMPEEKQPDQARELARAYRVYIDTFPRAEKLPDMLLNMAGVLGTAGLDLEAGRRALEAAQYMPDGKERSDALYDAVVYFQQSLAKEADRSQVERVTARAALRRAASQLLVYDVEADKARRVKYAIAQTYFDEGRYNEAIDKLSAVAYEFPGSEEGDAAINLVLDSYYTLNDFDGLMYAGRRFMSGGSPASDKLKADIKPIVEAAEGKKLDQLSLAAAGEDGGNIEALEEFAIQFEGTELGEKALLNAFVAAQAVGDTDKMFKLAEQLKAKYPDSEQLPGVYGTLAQTAVARFEFDKAVRYMKQAADLNPGRRVALLTTAGQLLEQMGDYSGAEQMYLSALRNVSGPGRTDILQKLSAVIELIGDPNATVQKLSPYAGEGNPEVLARLGLAQLALGRREEAENTLFSAQDGDTGGSAEASARANFGQAEVLLYTLKNYPDPEDSDMLSEFIALIEVVNEGYLDSARGGDPVFSSLALSRLAYASRIGAQRLRTVRMPSDLSPDEQTQVKAAMNQRAETLEATADQALEACAQQAWTNRLLNPIVRKCLQGQAWDKSVPEFDRMKKRGKVSPPGNLDELRAELSKNPEDTDKLREMANKFLDAGDPHVARLILVRAIQSGGTAEDQNVLGIASYKAGDIATAFDAFSQAAGSGSEAGRKNLAKLLNDIGLAKASKEVFERFPQGSAGGRTL